MPAALNIPSHMGWKAKAKAAADKKAARQESHQERGRFADCLRELGRAATDVTVAEDRVKALQADLAASEKRLDGFNHWTLQSGRVHPQAMATTFSIQQASAIIDRAEADLAAARDRHAAALSKHDAVMADAAADEPVQPDGAVPVTPETPPKSKRGRA